MRRSFAVINPFLLLLVLAALAAGCGRTEQQPPPAAQPSDAVDRTKLAVFAPLPDVAPPAASGTSEALVDLGRMLYYEPRLSKSQQISCNSCHELTKYGADGQPTSDGHKGQTGTRNSPTVYNFVFKVPTLRNIDQTGPYFHDGRVASLQDAVREMAEYQLGRTLSETEVGRIVVFLRVLRGRIPDDYIKAPVLP
jgi:cytochrome c peroxidase